MDLNNDVKKLTKVGGSYFLNIPFEYLKVFNMYNNLYQLSVKDEGKTIIFKKVGEKDESELNDDSLSNEIEIDNNVKQYNDSLTYEQGLDLNVEECIH